MKYKLFFARITLDNIRVNPRFHEFRQDILEPEDYELVGEFETRSDLFHGACGEIFDRFNIGDHGGRADLRSMSGGDFIELEDGTRVLYRSIGFRVYVPGRQPYNCGDFLPITQPRL